MAFRAASSLLPAIACLVVLLVSLGGSRLGVQARKSHHHPISPKFYLGKPEQVYRDRLGDRLEVDVLSYAAEHRVACAMTHVATGRIKQCRVFNTTPYAYATNGRRFVFDPLRKEDLGVYQARTEPAYYHPGGPTWNVTFIIAENGPLFVEGSPKQAYVGELGAPFSFSCASQPYLLQPVACSALHVETNRTIPCRSTQGNSSERTFIIPTLSVEHTGTYVCRVPYKRESGLALSKSFTITAQPRAAPRQAIIDLSLPSPYAIVRRWGSDVFVFLRPVPAGQSSLGSMVCRASPLLIPKASEIAWKVTGKSTAERGAGYRITTQADPMGAKVQFNTTGMALGQEFVCSVTNSRGRAESTVKFYEQGNMSARVLAFYKTTSTGNTTTTYTLKVALSGLPMGAHKYCVTIPRLRRHCTGWTLSAIAARSNRTTGGLTTLHHTWVPALKPNCEGIATWVLTAPTALASAMEHSAKVKLIMSGLQQEQAVSTPRTTKTYRFRQISQEDVALSQTLRCS